MKKRLIISLSILPLLMLVSCSSSPEQQSATPPSPPTGQASPPPAAPPPATPPAVSQAKTPSVISDKEIAQKGLVPSTNPEQRLKEIKQARNNPFGLIPIIPVVDSGETDVDSQTGGSQAIPGTSTTPETPTTPNGKSSPSSPTGSRPTQAPFYPIGRYCKFEGKIGGEIIEIQPEEAQGILVSGIVKLPTAAYAIVTPRNSKVTQSVRKGSFLGNGLVRVAAIDPVNETVIFEENGKFVYREIGQRPVATKSGIVQLKGESFPFKIKPPTSKQAYGTIVKGQKALMLTQASILLVNVAGEDKSGTLQQLASPPWARNPNPNTSVPGEVPAPNQPTDPQGTSAPNQPDGKGTQGTNPPPAPTNSPQGTGGSAPVSQASAPQKSTRLSGAICNDSNKRITVSRIKIQIQDAETNTVLDTQWSDVASTNVVLDRGQSAKFDVPIPRLQNSSSGTISVRLLDWQGG
jgi:hypothetical protein